MRRILTKDEWMKRQKRRRLTMTAVSAVIFIAIISFIILLTSKLFTLYKGSSGNSREVISVAMPNGEVIKQDFLTPNPYSRPGNKLKKVNSIVIHYTANPGTTAENNRSYFEGLADTKTTYASSHFIVGIEGEIIQCIPLNEISYASNFRNKDTISIECCHPDETGKFSEATYKSLISLAAVLCKQYGLGEDDIIRHYDITKKLCPLYYVKHEDAWNTLKKDIIEKTKEIPSQESDS